MRSNYYLRDMSGGPRPNPWPQPLRRSRPAEARGSYDKNSEGRPRHLILWVTPRRNEGGRALMPVKAAGSSFGAYLAQIRRFPILSQEEEFCLAERYSKDKNDIEAAQKLIASNLRFVVKVALQYKAYGIKIQDLVQEGNIGLIMALKKFDPYKGHRFVSYAVWWIRAYIQDFIMKNWSLVKIGTTQAEKKLFYKIGRVRKALEANQEEEEKYEILAKGFDVAKDDIIEMEQRMSSRDLSLDSSFDDQSKVTHYDLLQENSPNQEEIFGQKEERQILEKEIQEAIKQLNEKENYVLKNRTMADSPLTLEEIGKHLSLSRERVRQIESEAIKKLKAELTPRIHLQS